MINGFIHFTIIVLLVPCFVHAQTTALQSESSHAALARRAAEMGTGKWWVSLSDEARNKFIDRYTSLMDRAKSDLAGECAQEMKSLPRTVDEVDIISTMTLCKLASSLDFSFGTHTELREGVDGFYKDSANLTVPIDIALQRVRDVLAAKHPHAGGGIG